MLVFLFLALCLNLVADVVIGRRLSRLASHIEVLEDQLFALQTQLGFHASRRSRSRGTGPR